LVIENWSLAIEIRLPNRAMAIIPFPTDEPGLMAAKKRKKRRTSCGCVPFAILAAIPLVLRVVLPPTSQYNANLQLPATGCNWLQLPG